MKLWKSAVFIFLFAALFALLASAGWSQSPPASGRNVDNLGLQVQDQSQVQDRNKNQSQNPDQPSAPPQTPAGEGARATQENTISPKEAKKLFRSVDEILQFASEDTGLPIKHKVKRKLTKRDEVQSYIEKGMRDDKDAKRLERSSAVLKKFGLLPRDFDLSSFLVKMLREQVAGYYDVKTKTVNLLNWVDAEQQKPVLAHELTHALQDQSFRIEKFMKSAEGENEDKGKGKDKDKDKDEKDPSPADIAHDAQ